jgi:hypothetical protein
VPLGVGPIGSAPGTETLYVRGVRRGSEYGKGFLMSESADEVRVPRDEWEAMKARLAALERLVDVRTDVAIERDAVPSERPRGQETSVASGQSRTDRRGLLKQGAVLAAGAVTGGVVLVAAQAAPAAATTGAMQFGAANDAGNAVTSLTSTGEPTLSLANTAVGESLALWVTSGGARIDGSALGLLVNASTSGGPGLDVENAGYAGSAITGAQNNATNQQAAVYGATQGKGPGVEGYSIGGGPGVQGDSESNGPGVWGNSMSSPSLYACGVLGTAVGYGSGVVGTTGQGNGVYGYSNGGYGITGASTSGRGGHFSGVAAQIQLSPGSASTHPTSGATGDLYVDSTARLWFCTAGGSPATWKQVQVA